MGSGSGIRTSCSERSAVALLVLAFAACEGATPYSGACSHQHTGSCSRRTRPHRCPRIRPLRSQPVRTTPTPAPDRHTDAKRRSQQIHSHAGARRHAAADRHALLLPRGQRTPRRRGRQPTEHPHTPPHRHADACAEPAPASGWRTDVATGSGVGDRATDASLTLAGRLHCHHRVRRRRKELSSSTSSPPGDRPVTPSYGR